VVLGTELTCPSQCSINKYIFEIELNNSIVNTYPLTIGIRVVISFIKPALLIFVVNPVYT
jgi:hypothetical protein